MTVNKSINGRVLTISIEGRIDTGTAPELDKEIKSSSENADSLILDFKNVNYISSSGLRVLLSAHKEMDKKDGMKVINAGQDIMEIFEVTGFSDILDIE